MEVIVLPAGKETKRLIEAGVAIYNNARKSEDPSIASLDRAFFNVSWVDRLEESLAYTPKGKRRTSRPGFQRGILRSDLERIMRTIGKEGRLPKPGEANWKRIQQLTKSSDARLEVLMEKLKRRNVAARRVKAKASTQKKAKKTTKRRPR